MVVLAKNKTEFLEIIITTINNNEKEQQKDVKQNIIFYPVIEVLFLVIVAMLSGEENFDAIVNFGVEHLSILKKYLSFTNKVPKNIIVRLFSVISIKNFDIWLRNLNNIILFKLNLANRYIIEKHIEDSFCLIDSTSILLRSCKNVQQKYSIINYINLVDYFMVATNVFDDAVEFRLDLKNEQNNYQISNNMLAVRNMVFDIIKKHKIKKRSKLGINAIRRLANNNSMVIIDILDNWIYNNHTTVC